MFTPQYYTETQVHAFTETDLTHSMSVIVLYLEKKL